MTSVQSGQKFFFAQATLTRLGELDRHLTEILPAESRLMDLKKHSEAT